MDANTSTTSESPTKRRALAALNANTTMSPRRSPLASKPAAASQTTSLGLSPVKPRVPQPTAISSARMTASPTTTKQVLSSSATNLSSSPRKRQASEETQEEGDEMPAAAAQQSSAKKARVSVRDVNEEERNNVAVSRSVSSRSASPSETDTSLFDTSATEGDSSWATIMTEPDVAPAARQRTLTREQAREKVDILRLRLGLANYKLRTGQTNVPLAKLQRKPLPSSTSALQSSRALEKDDAVPVAGSTVSETQPVDDAEGRETVASTAVGEDVAALEDGDNPETAQQHSEAAEDTTSQLLGEVATKQSADAPLV